MFGFGQLLRSNKQSEDVTLAFWDVIMDIFHFLLTSLRANDSPINQENNRQFNQ